MAQVGVLLKFFKYAKGHNIEQFIKYTVQENTIGMPPIRFEKRFSPTRIFENYLVKKFLKFFSE